MLPLTLPIYALRLKIPSIPLEIRMQLLLFLCRPYNLRILQHKKNNYSDNHSGRAYKQGTLTVKVLTNKVLEHAEAIAIRAIGWEVRFGQQFRRYRYFISLNVRMLPLCYRYVIIYAYSTQNMLLQRSSVALFDAYQSIFYLLKEGGRFDK